jgi:GH25 family lysozyme M1 (1,4-beta-N-acetylmuramidase)
MLSALLLFTAAAVTAPSSAQAATATRYAACDGVALRVYAGTTGTLKGRINEGARITIVATVTGGAWRATCDGLSVSGNRWYRISAVNGTSVRSLYGATYVYAAIGLFESRSSTTTTTTTTKTATRYAACDGVGLRTTASSSATLRARIPEGARVTIVATVSGGSWKQTTCLSSPSSGSRWYRISAVNGKSVSALWGRSYLYAPSGFFRTTPLLETRWAACDDVSLRSGAGTTGTLMDRIHVGDRVTVVAKVSGGAWSAECGGQSVSGGTWYRISAVNGTLASTLYGRSYVYAATGLFSASSPSSSTPDAGSGAVTEGIDVSHWQGTVDWAKVRAAGKRFVFLKSSENASYVDPTYASNRSGARAAGMYVGAYHFAQPSLTSGDAVAEADHFINTAKPQSGDLLPVLDLEVTNGLSPSQLQTWTRSFLERVYARTGVRAVIYVSPAFWRNSMGDTTWFADNGYKVLWIAHWTTTLSTPSVPASSWGGEGWTFWQYSSTGTVPGISGRVDLNRYNGTDFRPVLVP